MPFTLARKYPSLRFTFASNSRELIPAFYFNLKTDGCRGTCETPGVRGIVRHTLTPTAVDPTAFRSAEHIAKGLRQLTERMREEHSNISTMMRVGRRHLYQNTAHQRAFVERLMPVLVSPQAFRVKQYNVLHWLAEVAQSDTAIRLWDDEVWNVVPGEGSTEAVSM